MPTNYMLVTIKAKPKHIQRTPDPRAVTMLSKCFYAYHVRLCVYDSSGDLNSNHRHFVSEGGSNFAIKGCGRSKLNALSPLTRSPPTGSLLQSSKRSINNNVYHVYLSYLLITLSHVKSEEHCLP